MPSFYLNRNSQPTGEHEVHEDTNRCPTPALPQNRIALGFHATCYDAVLAAKRAHPGVAIDGCKHCAPLCHTR